MVPAGSTPYRNYAADETVVLVVGGSVLLYNYTCYNPNGTAAFVQLFDANETTDVTLGSTTPSFVLPLPPTGGLDTGLMIPKAFRNGIVMAVTASATGSGAPSSDCVVQLDYTGG